MIQVVMINIDALNVVIFLKKNHEKII